MPPRPTPAPLGATDVTVTAAALAVPGPTVNLDRAVFRTQVVLHTVFFGDLPKEQEIVTLGRPTLTLN
jgi:hypothetical protein